MYSAKVMTTTMPGWGTDIFAVVERGERELFMDLYTSTR